MAGKDKIMGFKMKGWSGWSPFKTHHTKEHEVDFDSNIKGWDGTSTSVNPIKVTREQKKYDKLLVEAITEKDPNKQKKKEKKFRREHDKITKDKKRISLSIPRYKIEFGHRTSGQKWPLRIIKK
tara:strand:+ start:41 stop:412 length:372 start_codon:yes stop_codon:yes gene_type:complete